MNTFSKTHKRFSELLRNSRVLTNPEEFLGPNYKEVLNFWLILDELSEEELEAVEEREWAFYYENCSEWFKATYLSFNASYEVAYMNYADEAAEATYYVTKYYVACRATTELIAMHLILEQQPLTFFEMFLNL